jgi:hypothetical protein
MLALTDDICTDVYCTQLELCETPLRVRVLTYNSQPIIPLSFLGITLICNYGQSVFVR